MKLIVGLGNPGRKYEATRHNIGFLVIDEVSKQLAGIFQADDRSNSEIAEVTSSGSTILLIKPQTYMNRVGESIRSLANYYRVSTDNIWVVSDDLDLPLGYIRVRHTGASGGHNGLKSVIEALQTPDFGRIRVGIGQTIPVDSEVERTDTRIDAEVYVLQPFLAREVKLRDAVVSRAASIIVESLKSGKLIRHTYKLPDPAP